MLNHILVDEAVPDELEDHRVVKRDVRSRVNRQVQIRVAGCSSSTRIDDNDFRIGVTSFPVLNPFPDNRMTFDGIRTSDKKTFSMIEVLITPGRFVSAGVTDEV